MIIIIVWSRVYLQCIGCGKEAEPQRKNYRCGCGDLFDVSYDFTKVNPTELKELFRARRMSYDPLDQSGVWRYMEFLPFTEEDRDSITTMSEGNTPLFEAPRCSDYAGVHVVLKHQGMNPTGSFKDVGMTVAISQARKLGCETVACASTGNTSASVAAYAARAGMKALVLIPDGQIAYGKLAQALDYGAYTLMIKGDFDDALRIVEEISRNNGIYLMNSLNPYRLEGQKTTMIELMDQLNWRVPDRVVVPGGNMGNSSSFGKALREMYDLGIIEKMPRITIIQAEGADPLYRALSSGEELRPIEAHTLASAIKIGNPVNWKKAVRAMDWTDGWCQSVSEREIADAKAVIGRDGIGCEPASAATIAGLKRMVEMSDPHVRNPFVDRDELVIAILTGNQLKDPDYTVNYHKGTLEGIESRYGNQPIRVDADKRSINRALSEMGLR